MPAIHPRLRYVSPASEAWLKVAVDIPDELEPAELDKLLHRGWFRSGPLLYRAPLLPIDHRLRELVHLRLRLDGEVPKNRRRLLKRNRERFRTVFGPATLDNARRRLYRRMRPRFVGFVMRDLDGLGMTHPPFDTREVAVYDGDKLIAIGWFDLGRRAAAGLLGMHDPAYAKHGLGIYTMLEEMAYARSHSARWYYPGYVVPGVPAFDYKLGLGQAQFLRPDGRWRQLARAPSSTPIATRAHAEMEALEAALARAGFATERRVYPSMWLGWVDDQPAPYLRGMWHLSIHAPGLPELVVEHLPTRQAFVAATVRHETSINPFEDVLPASVMKDTYELRVLAYETILARTRSMDQAVRGISRFVQQQRTAGQCSPPVPPAHPAS